MGLTFLTNTLFVQDPSALPVKTLLWTVAEVCFRVIPFVYRKTDQSDLPYLPTHSPLSKYSYYVSLDISLLGLEYSIKQPSGK